MQNATEIPAAFHPAKRGRIRRILLSLGIGFLLLVSGVVICLGWLMRRPIHNQDSFEEPGLDSVWISKAMVPEAFSIQNRIVRGGRYAAQIVLKSGDVHEDASWKGEANERDEICEAPWFWSRMDRTYQYSFSLFLPKDFPIVDTRLVIAQWKQVCEWFGCRPPNPVLAIRYSRGELFVTRRGDEGQTRLYTSLGEMRGRWLDFRFVIRFSQKEDGFINGWLNGQQIVKYTGVTAYRSSFGYTAHGFFYFKMGLYRDPMKELMTIYLDEFRKDQL